MKQITMDYATYINEILEAKREVYERILEQLRKVPLNLIPPNLPEYNHKLDDIITDEILRIIELVECLNAQNEEVKI
jgi:hypothetical protein